MKKVFIILSSAVTIDQVHDILAKYLELPETYGRNLDALHDCLNEITEDTCIGVYEPAQESPIGNYMKRLNCVFLDCEAQNPHLCIFTFQKEMNFVKWLDPDDTFHL